MKKLLFALALIFTFSSCEDLLDASQACEDEYNYHIEFKVTACVFKNGKVEEYGDMVEFTTTKYYCDEHSYPMDGAVKTGPNGCGKGNSIKGYQLHNNFDYVIVTAWLRNKVNKRLQTSRRYDYKDFPSNASYSASKTIDVHFTFDL